MDVVASLPDPTISKVLMPTIEAFYPLLLAHKNNIESIPRRTFKYGTHHRHHLDVYYPISPVNNGQPRKVPVLFFGYGGGFNDGHRHLPPPYDLLWRNIGSFFARQGIFTVIPDYRVIPPAKYPEPVQDIADAIAWVVTNSPEIDRKSPIKLDVNNLFLLGVSAGATYMSTLILSPRVLPGVVGPHIRGVVLMGGAYAFTEEDPIVDLLREYYGGEERMREYEPLALAKNAPQELLNSLPEILLIRCEKDPGYIIECHNAFMEALDVQEMVLEKHNHMSPSVCLSSGEGEEWGHAVVEWIRSRAVL